jgi:hypothetical protein
LNQGDAGVESGHGAPGVRRSRLAEGDRAPGPHRIEGEDRPRRAGPRQLLPRGRGGEPGQPIPGEGGENGNEGLDRRALGEEERLPGRLSGLLGIPGIGGEELEEDLGTDPGGIALGESEDRASVQEWESRSSPPSTLRWPRPRRSSSSLNM